MHLVHVRLRTPDGFQPPDDLNVQLLTHAIEGEQVEHISIHRSDAPSLTIGLFVAADSLIAAEAVALAVVRRAVLREPVLSSSRITSCSGAIVGAYFDGLLGSRDGDGRSMPLPYQDTEES
ncbi:hypothetical protein [Sphaerimonospora mesophila]|uniref:hypothetical protein n=1 Tax=Sphaerimonospora mesophila TaxID=37483 RepID=UPI000B2C2F9D